MKKQRNWIALFFSERVVLVSVPVVTVLIAVMFVLFIFVFLSFISLDEINRLVTGIIFVAMLGPFFCMAGRLAHVNRRWGDACRRDNHGLRINHRGIHTVADIDAAVRRKYLADGAVHRRLCLRGE